MGVSTSPSRSVEPQPPRSRAPARQPSAAREVRVARLTQPIIPGEGPRRDTDAVFAAAGSGHGTETWASASWRELAVAWLDERLADAALERTGEVEQPHLQPWGTVLKAPTADGPVWLKAAGPATAFEVRLYDLLQRVAPDQVLHPIAIDLERAWVLLPDGGPPLGEALTRTDLAEAMARALPQYGQLQRDLSPHADELLALGVADMRPEADAGEVHGGAGGRGRVRRAARKQRRSARPLPAWRLSARRSRRGASGSRTPRARPASTTTTCTRSTCWSTPTDAPGSTTGATAWWRIRSPACSCRSVGCGTNSASDSRTLRSCGPGTPTWRSSATSRHTPSSSEALELACHVGKTARALTWERAVSELAAEGGEHADAPLRSLADLLDDSYVGHT